MLVEEPILHRRDDADDLDRFAAFDFSALFRRVSGRDVEDRELHSLPKRIAIRPQFLRQVFIDDSDRRAARLRRFRVGKGATAQHRQTDRGEIISTTLFHQGEKVRPSAAVAGFPPGAA